VLSSPPFANPKGSCAYSSPYVYSLPAGEEKSTTPLFSQRERVFFLEISKELRSTRGEQLQRGKEKGERGKRNGRESRKKQRLFSPLLAPYSSPLGRRGEERSASQRLFLILLKEENIK